MPHSSAHPCTWCDINKGDLENAGTLRTISNITNKYNKWTDNGSKLANAKIYGNCTNIPIVATEDPNNDQILHLIPPPELHLMLGVVNKIYSEMMLKHPDIALKWAKNCNLERHAYHGGCFNGNACRKLLKQVDILASMCPLDCLKYVHVLRNFNNVVISCFGKELKINFENCIDQFKNSYLAADLNVTPKVHAVFHHVKEFCAFHQIGLGLYSEQASEAVHYDFANTWNSYKLRMGHCQYAERLLKAVCRYNSVHL